jgi:GTP-binding protein
MRVHTKFLTSAADARQFPPPVLPEIAFLGRSNVGKSSVINSLLGEKVAKTSATPGRTRTINFFEVRRPGQPRADFIFADLPGYGFTKLPKEVVAEWPKFIEPYLKDRASLALCVALVDANVPPQASDKQLVEWLQHAQRRFVIVATKADKLGGNQLSNSLRKLTEELGTERVVPYSARTKVGSEELWREIWAAREKVVSR